MIVLLLIRLLAICVTKVYIIDGILISDTSNVRIEATAIKSIDILNMETTKGIY
jgi:hypothetical protein